VSHFIYYDERHHAESHYAECRGAKWFHQLAISSTLHQHLANWEYPRVVGQDTPQGPRCWLCQVTHLLVKYPVDEKTG
jgi:hypothetical protein